MTTNDLYSRIWFETIDASTEAGTDRAEAEQIAVASIMAEVRAGNIRIDYEKAIVAELRKVDAAHGRAADNLLEKIASGAEPLELLDFELVVTLGGGRRKTWYYVNAEDLDAMNDIRFRNYKNARDSFQVFNGNVTAVRPTVFLYGTVGAAYEAGAFGADQAVA